ncbi:fasciclin domain-containing protein [Halobacteria archaeon HArc-curdl5-1]|uniref:Fasciclin domain-containing protein n=1 Tax=Halapricum hydrolyticum TaxID=2979991 RepID=A0AAE3IDI8_9EURY|nr:fasciclin domain-containing protein [Halapricum hydrolyticum]MCU4718417.1 fasciclin domain-containing protein [Halapricum hydrolyticum]MCU4726470.1 fasciclin domain-containing protein [Halapricum hydrolyticum]
MSTESSGDKRTDVLRPKSHSRNRNRHPVVLFRSLTNCTEDDRSGGSGVRTRGRRNRECTTETGWECRADARRTRPRGRRYAKSVLAAPQLRMLNRDFITQDGGVLNDGQATIVATDFEASNGVLHAIDGVLLPE